MSCISTILAFYLTLPSWYQDAEPRDVRAQLYSSVVRAVCEVGKTPRERARLAVQAYAETKLSRYVLEDRCSDGPPGARCDRGHAVGPWQVHRHCRKAWDTTLSRHERFSAGARCASQAGNWGLWHWKTGSGWYQAQRGISKDIGAWARRREAQAERLATKL